MHIFKIEEYENFLNDKEALSDLLMANVEALASDEAQGNSVTCYSSSRSRSGSTYYDWGRCTREFNSEGTGSSSICAASSF